MTRQSRWPGRDPHSDERVTPERAQILLEEASESLELGDIAGGRELFSQCARIFRKLKRRQEEAECLVKAAECSERIDEYKESRTQYEEAIAIYRELKDVYGLSAALLALGGDALNRENFTYAAKLLRESSEICEKEGLREGYAVCLYLLAAPELNSGGLKESHQIQAKADHASRFTDEGLALAEATIRLAKSVARFGESQRAQSLFELSVRHYRSSGYLAETAPCLLKIARACYLDGRPEMFACLVEGVLLLYTAGRNRREYAAALRDIGNHALRVGDTASAYSLFKESMNRSQGPESWSERASSYLALGCVASREEHHDIARSLFEKAFAALKEGASGAELLELYIKLCRRVHHTEDLNAAALYFARCALHARSLGEITFYIQAMYYRGCIAIQQGDYAAANRHLEECLIYYGEAGPQRRLGRTLTEKGAALFAVGEESRGRSYINKGMEIARNEKDEVGAAAALASLGAWVPQGSDGSFEKQCLEEAGAIADRHLVRSPQRSIAHLLADVDRKRGNINEASRQYLRCLVVMGQEGRLMTGTAAIEGMAIIASGAGLFHESVRLMGRAGVCRRNTGSTPTATNAGDIDSAISIARRELNPADFDTAWSEGERFGTGETVRAAWTIVQSRRFAF